jgi:hypothetical protein
MAETAGECQGCDAGVKMSLFPTLDCRMDFLSNASALWDRLHLQRGPIPRAEQLTLKINDLIVYQATAHG